MRISVRRIILASALLAMVLGPQPAEACSRILWHNDLGTNYHYDMMFEPGVEESKRHLATFKKWPMKDLGLTAGK